MASSNPLKNWMTQYGESEEEYDSRKQAAFDAVRNKYTPKIEERKKREAEQREKNTYIPAQFGQRMLESQNRRRYENTYVPASLAENALHSETDGEDYLSYSNARLRGEYLARADTAKLQGELDALERSIEQERKQYNRAKLRLASYGNNVGTTAARADQRYIDAYEQKQAKAETLRRDIRDAGALQAEIARQSQQIANEKRYRNTYIPASLAQDAIHRSGNGADFNAYADARLRGEYISHVDTAKLQSELDALEKELSERKSEYLGAQSRSQHVNRMYRDRDAIERESAPIIEAYRALEERAETLRRDIKDADALRKGAEYDALRGRADFAEKSKASSSKRVEFDLLDPSTWAAGDDTYDFINNIGGYRNIVRGLAEADGEPMEYGTYSGLARMSQDEIANYNYLYATEGKQEADAYLDFLEEELNYRQGQAEAALIGDDVLRAMGYSMGAGIRRFGDNIGDMFAGGAEAVRPYEYGTQAVRENLADSGAKLPDWMGGGSVGQAAFDLAGTAGNMLPSILLSTLTGGAGASTALASAAGSASMGLSAGGGARMQALREGYTPEQATQYGVLIGASEGALQYLLGGMSKLGGKLTGGAAAKAIQNIDNALLRVAANGAIHMAGEGAEEYLQEILDPIYRNLLLDENNEIDLADPEAVYSFMLGALTAGVMDMPQIVSDGRTSTPSLQNGASAADASSATIPGRNNIDLVPSGNTEPGTTPGGPNPISQGLSTDTIPETGEKGNRADVRSRQEAALEGAARELATTLEGATKHRYAVQEGANGGAELQARGKTIRLDAVEATALAEAYEGGMDAVEYALAFHAVYEQARQGKELSQIKGTGIGRSFSKPDIRAAYSAGQLANQRAAALDPNSEFKAGVTMLPDAQLSREQEAQLNVLDAICRKYGVSAIVDDALYLDESGKTRGNVNAAYNGNTNRIHINLNALGDAYLAVGMHELTHYVKANNAAGYSTLEGFVLDALRSMGEDVDALVRYQMDQFGYSEAIAREEVVANTIPAILNDETYVKRLIEADRTLAERIRDFLREFIDTIKETLRTLEGEASWKQMQSIRQDTELLSTIADLFDVALGETQNQRSKTPIHGERFSIKYDVNNRPFVVVEENILDGVPKKNWVKTVKENLKAKFPDGVTVGRNKISINQTSRREMTFSKYMQWALKNDRPAYADKLRATDNADELLRASRDYVNEALLHPRNDRIREFARGNVLLRVGSNDYTASVIVGTYESGQMLLYDVISLMPTTITERQNAKDTATKQRKGEVGRSAVSTATVLQSDTSVNRSIRKNVQEDAKDIYDRQINLSAQDIEAISEQEGARATELTGKRKAYKRRHERAFIENVAKALGIPGTAKGELRKMLSELGDRVIATGQISEADKTAMFEACYKAAREYDNSLVEQYGPLKEYLRNKAIRSTDLTSEQRSAAWGKLRMNGNGAPLANVYDDLLAEFPGVFDNALTSPEDQFAEILNKYDSIKTREYTLDEFHGENAPAVKAEMRADFEEALFQLRRKLNLADRSETALHTKRQERLRAAAEAENVQTVEKALSEIKEKQKALDRVMRKLELTEGDRSLMDAVFKGGITLGELQSRSNFDELKAYYDARAEVENRQKIIDEYNKKRRERLRNDAMHAIENSDRWKDKRIGGLYERETQERNIRDITGSEQDAERIIAGYIQPVHKNEAKRTRYINDMNARLLALKRNKNGKPVGLNKWESKATQLIGEAADYRERLAEIEKRRMGNSKEAKLIRKGLDLVGTEYAELFEKHGKEIDLAACEAALPEVREIYDQVFRDMNDALVRNGYPKVEYRKNYFPHFIGREYDSEGQKIAKAFGFNLTNMELPTDIAGLTSAFRPGKTWFNNALERMGVKTEFDLYGGFDSYIRGATDVIFHTDDIQRLRALDNAIRYKYSDEGRRARMKELLDNENITPEERAEQINALYTDEKGNSMTTHLSGYVSNLTEYTNLLANKKSLQDRGAEKRWGRKIYSLANWLQNRYSANAIAGNLGVSISNFIPITQATSEVGNATLLRAMRDTVRSFAKDDGFSEQSAFLTNRRGTDVLSKDWIMKANDKLSIPFEGVDRFASETLVRAKFAQNLKAGMSAEAAIENADAWAAGLMADRSKGALPTIFGSKSPLAKAFTMFQVEGNNQLSYMFKDVPRDMKEKGIAAIVGALFKMFLAAWMYNELDEQLTGRRRALDPLHMVAEAIGVDWKTEHIIPRITGTKTADEAPLFTYTPQSLVGAAEDLYKGIVDQTPFFGSLLGGDGGRSPAAAAMPDIWRIAKTLWNEDADGAYKGAVVWDELKKPLFYTLPPFAGGQVKKAAEGFATVHKGGSYKKDKEGNDLLRFRTDQKGLDYAQAILFGPWALPEGRENIAQGFPTLSAAHTAAYKNAVASGVDGAHFLVLLDRYKALEPIKNEAGKTEQSTKQQFREMLFRDSSLTNEQKTQMDRDLLCTEGQSPADYSSKSRFELSNHSPSAYERFEENIAGGMSEEEAFQLEDWANRFAGIQSYTDERGNYVGPQEQKRRMLFADETLTADEKEQIDRALIMGDGENARPADYSAKAMFDLFMQSESGYDNVIGATRKGIPEALALKVETWRQNQIARGNFSKDGYVDYMRGLGMSTSQINIILAETNKSWKPIE